MTEAVKTLKQWVDESSRIVFFGGAGVSTESGIPDFRSTDGLYHQNWAYPPETILSHTFYESKPEEFFKFYREKLLISGVQPNAAHKQLGKSRKINGCRHAEYRRTASGRRKQECSGITRQRPPELLRTVRKIL